CWHRGSRCNNCHLTLPKQRSGRVFPQPAKLSGQSYNLVRSLQYTLQNPDCGKSRLESPMKKLLLVPVLVCLVPLSAVLKADTVVEEIIARVNNQIITRSEYVRSKDQLKQELQQQEPIKLSEILISTQKAATPASEKSANQAPISDDPQQLAAAEAKAQNLLAQIRKGASFEDIAKKNSDGPSAAQGGDLGYFKRGTLAKELEDKTFAMKPGDISDVIPTKQGLVILKVTEHQAAGVPTLKEIEPRIQDAIYMQKLQPALRAYLTKLREEAYIDIKPGYADAGASAKQTKPVETTAKEANAKTLKK